MTTAPLAIIGLGYVGLPLAVEFGRIRKTIAFDISAARVAELKRFRDSTLEVDSKELRAAKQLKVTSSLTDLRRCTTFIVTVPTPNPAPVPLLNVGCVAPARFIDAVPVVGIGEVGRPITKCMPSLAPIVLTPSTAKNVPLTNDPHPITPPAEPPLNVAVPLLPIWSPGLKVELPAA